MNSKLIRQTCQHMSRAGRLKTKDMYYLDRKVVCKAKARVAVCLKHELQITTRRHLES